MIHRRRLLQGLGGAALAFSTPLSLAAPGLDLSNSRDRLLALAKMRGSSNGMLTIGWVKGARYAVVDSKAIPMLGILAGTFSQYRRLDDDTFEARALEVAYFTDLDTGRLLETWENPVTGKTVEVPQTRMGPSRIYLRAEGLEIPNPSGEATGMEIRHEFREPIQFQGRVWITEEIRVESEPRKPGGKGFRYNEMTTYESRLAVELAQLEYRLPRLTRMWTHLARQAGGRAGGAMGGVGLRGPGEKQIESDRREIQRRIAKVKEELEGVRTRRGQ